MLTYRKLEPKEWPKLRPIFQFNKAFLPDPVASVAAVVENEDGELVGFLMFQLVPHTEPLWIREDYRGKVDFRRLQRMIEPPDASNSLCAPGLFLVAESPNVEEMARICGYRKHDGTVWVKDLREKEAAA